MMKCLLTDGVTIKVLFVSMFLLNDKNSLINITRDKYKTPYLPLERLTDGMCLPFSRKLIQKKSTKELVVWQEPARIPTEGWKIWTLTNITSLGLLLFEHEPPEKCYNLVIDDGGRQWFHFYSHRTILLQCVLDQGLKARFWQGYKCI